MRVLFEIAHPKGANIFRNIIERLEKRDHTIKIVARTKENLIEILESYKMKYEKLPHFDSRFSKASGIFKIQYHLLKIARKFSPDIFISPVSPYSSYVSKILDKPCISFTDTDTHKKIVYDLSLPFTDVVFIPSCFRFNLGKRERRYNGYTELFYLHPENFKPSPKILKEIGLSKKEKYVVMRVSSLKAYHDASDFGMGFRNENELLEFIRKIESYCRIFVFSEEDKECLKDYKLDLPPDELHNFLYYSTGYIGDGASMASEAAVLGVPSFYISSPERVWGYIQDLSGYGLIRIYRNRITALQDLIEVIENSKIRKEYGKKRNRMISEKVNPINPIVEFIEIIGGA